MANVAVPTNATLGAAFNFQLFDDFYNKLDTTNNYIATLTDSGSITVANTNGGVAPLVPSDGTVADNDEAYLGMSVYPFLVAASKNMVVGGRAQFTEANTSAANIGFGLTSSVAANLLIDDGGGIRASGTSFAIVKVDGGTVWQCVSRNGSTAYTNTSTETAGGSSYFTWEINISELLSTACTVTFKVNNQYLKDSTTGQVIRHKVLYSGLSAVSPFYAIKNGSTTLETLNADNWYVGQSFVRN